MMRTKVFISYRRDSTAGHAGRIRDRLQAEFGVFMDVDAIPLGSNFGKVLRSEVANCGVLLAVIGSDWLDLRDENGERRLDNPDDLVRIEIATALRRDIPVIPVLLDRAELPGADELPEELGELPLRHGLVVRHASFDSDMDKLIKGIREIVPIKPEDQQEAKPPARLELDYERDPYSGRSRRHWKWTSFPGATEYILEKSSDNSFGYRELVYRGPETKFAESGIYKSAYYPYAGYYRVKAQRGDENMATSKVVAAPLETMD